MILNVCNLPGTLYDNYAQHLIGKTARIYRFAGVGASNAPIVESTAEH